MFSTAKNELYSLRLEIIKWFERHHLDEFDLYGYGWDSYYLYFLNKKIFKTKLFKNLRKSYKGEVEDKISTLNKYKFCICFENARDEYHIDEKIIDCFNAGIIPIYYGAPNIEDIVPKNCFINFKNFKNLKDMYIFMKNFSEDDYKLYEENIKNFLKSDSCEKYFSVNSWITSIYSSILRLSN